MPLRICTRAPCRTPTVTGRSCATESAEITMTFCFPASPFRRADAGTTKVFWMVSAMIETRAVAPGFRRSPGFAICTQTSTVVALGLADGLTTVTVPGMSPSGPATRAGRPTRRSEEHTSELQSRFDLVCRLLLEKKNKTDVTLTAASRRQH